MLLFAPQSWQNEFCRQVRANHENSPLPEPGLPTIGKNRFRKRQPFWFLSDPMGRRHRYRCVVCEKTFCSTIGTPYYRLQHCRDTFDQVATLSVEGLNKSAISSCGWRILKMIPLEPFSAESNSVLQEC